MCVMVRGASMRTSGRFMQSEACSDRGGCVDVHGVFRSNQHVCGPERAIRCSSASKKRRYGDVKCKVCWELKSLSKCALCELVKWWVVIGLTANQAVTWGDGEAGLPL